MKKLIAAIGVAAGLAFSCGSASAAVIVQAFGPFSDVDEAAPQSFSFEVAEGGTITDLNISLTLEDPINNPCCVWFSDLEISLTHNGVTVLFSDNIGGSGVNDPATVFYDDEGAGLIPSNPLLAFDGLDAAGTWTLTFLDNVFSGESDIASGYLEIETAAVPLPATALLMVTGLVGLGVARRRMT